jgi:hypothetical protein
MTQSTVTARPGSGSEVRPVSDLPDPRRARFEKLFTRHHDEQSGPVPPNWYVIEPSSSQAGKRVSLGVSPTPMR